MNFYILMFLLSEEKSCLTAQKSWEIMTTFVCFFLKQILYLKQPRQRKQKERSQRTMQFVFMCLHFCQIYAYTTKSANTGCVIGNYRRSDYKESDYRLTASVRLYYIPLQRVRLQAVRLQAVLYPTTEGQITRSQTTGWAKNQYSPFPDLFWIFFYYSGSF